MTAPPEPPGKSAGPPRDDDDHGLDDLDDLPELTIPLEDPLPDPVDELAGAPPGARLTARLGEPGGEIGIGAPVAADEAAIPMLTEVLATPAPPPATRGERPALLSEGEAPDLDRLALQVQADVLENLQVRTDSLIEGPLDERLQAVIELSTERLVDEIRETLRQAIREAVGRAISEELARVHRAMDEDEHPPAN